MTVALKYQVAFFIRPNFVVYKVAHTFYYPRLLVIISYHYLHSNYMYIQLVNSISLVGPP